MSEEVFLVKGVPPKSTGQLLADLGRLGFPRVKHLKRVKSRDKGCNLVLLDCLPRDGLASFQGAFKGDSQAIWQLEPAEPDRLRLVLQESCAEDPLAKRLLQALDSAQSGEAFFLMKVLRTEKRLVKVNRRST